MIITLLPPEKSRKDERKINGMGRKQKRCQKRQGSSPQFARYMGRGGGGIVVRGRSKSSITLLVHRVPVNACRQFVRSETKIMCVVRIQNYL